MTIALRQALFSKKTKPRCRRSNLVQGRLPHSPRTKCPSWQFLERVSSMTSGISLTPAPCYASMSQVKCDPLCQKPAVQPLYQGAEGAITPLTLWQPRRAPPSPRYEEVRVAMDSPLEGDGFEPSVPQQIRSRFRESRVAWRFDRLATRNWKFESISLQRRVICEPDFLAFATAAACRASDHAT